MEKLVTEGDQLIEEDLRLRVIRYDPRLLAEESIITSQKAGMSDKETGY